MAITIDQFALGSFHYIRYPFSFFRIPPCGWG